MYNVVYCFDKNYQQHFAASLQSLVKNFSKDPALLCVHIVTDIASDELTKFIGDFSDRHKIDARIHQLNSAQMSFIEKVPAKFRKLKGYLNISAYFRLLIPLLLGEDVERAVYVESDTILVSDISELYSIDLGGKAIGAVLDVNNNEASKQHGLNAYYNSGLLVMCIRELRMKDFSNRTMDYISSASSQIMMADQCAINIVMKNDICSIPEKWNRYVSNSKFSIAHAEDRINGAALIHFITENKPWHDWFANDLGELYWDNLRASQWPNPVSNKPVTVNEHILMARKLKKQEKYIESISMYETIVTHLMKKK
ncbi:glycosyltransferase family 8 protein [Caulobacter henricii]|uniref:glycosyltransferase family 8 protein n=1 Tax=Caulobacter henricii TaxID=69395 RepID=UPI000A00FF4F|nr:glycosyltransferase family 8 protein [Caulobacter henricii]